MNITEFIKWVSNFESTTYVDYDNLYNAIEIESYDISKFEVIHSRFRSISDTNTTKAAHNRLLIIITPTPVEILRTKIGQSFDDFRIDLISIRSNLHQFSDMISSVDIHKLCSELGIKVSHDVVFSMNDNNCYDGRLNYSIILDENQKDLQEKYIFLKLKMGISQ